MSNPDSPVRRLELLNKFSKLLLEADSEYSVAWAIAKQAVAHLGFEDCVVYLVDHAMNQLRQIAAHGPKNPREFEVLGPIRIPIGQGIVGAAASTGKAQRVDDVTADPRYILDDEPRLSEMAVPMMHQGVCVGVIDSEDNRKGFFTADHQSVVQTVAALGAARIVHIRAIEALQQSQSEFRSLIEQATDIVFRTDLRGRFTYTNPIAVRVVGYSEEELLSSRFTDLLSESHRERVMAFYEEQ